MMDVAAAWLGSLVPALGWTLAHFLWQGALVALVLKVLLGACRTARARHDLALAALVLMAALPVATFAWLQGDVRIVFVPPGFPGLQDSGLGWEAVAVAAWLAGVAVLAVRTAGGLLLIEKIRRGARPLPAAWAERCRTLHQRMTGSLGVVFAQSEAITAPLVAGWLKPMVLIPTAALTRLPVAQLEALILHELAHVRRLDAFANLIQTIVETALFYHPAVWWVSRRIRAERENCCDDLAVAAVRDPALYVRALQAMDVLRAAPSGVLAANGGDLKSRAARVLGLAAAPARPALSRTAAMLILTAAAAAMTHSAAVQAEPSEAPAASTAPAAPSTPTAPATAASTAPLEPTARIVLAALSPAANLPTAVTPPPASYAVLAQAPTLPITALAAAAGPNTVSPVDVSPPPKPLTPDVKIEMRGSDADPGRGVAIWPADAYQARYDGRVTLRCLIDVHGLALRCDVAAESPKGRGFGKAALQMRPTIKLEPTQGQDGPVEAIKFIAVAFKAPDTQIERTYIGTCSSDDKAGNVSCSTSAGAPEVMNNPLAMRQVTMLDFPVWAQAASFDDLARAYPAKAGGAEGYAAAHCRVLRSGALTECQILKETPQGQGFGKAALSLTSQFRVAPQLAATHHAAPLWVDVPIRFPTRAELADRTIMAPLWTQGLDTTRPPRIFPPEAAASGVRSGRGVARCIVGADGSMTQCTPESAEPEGLGFSEAAAKLASAMKMNLWSADGAPVAGGVVHVPVRLNLKGGG